MYKGTSLILILITLLFTETVNAQLPAAQNNKVSLRKAYYGGVQLHTSGWGATFTYSKFKTFKTKNTLSFELVSLKHSKETKRISTNDERAKSYHYGKLNTLTLLRLNKGIKKIIYEKKRDQGLEVAYNIKYGVTVGFLKPVFLEILKVTANQKIELVSERYDPEFHHVNNIYGRSSKLMGLSQTKLTGGGNFKASFIFDFSSSRKKVKSLELGAGVDVFYKEVPLMAKIKNTFIYPTVFLNFQFGKKTL